MSETPQLGDEERAQADQLETVPTSVIFEAIRRQGEHELSRTSSALWWSGVAAGLAISTSVLCKGFLVAALPDADWTKAVANLGYTVGFLIVILGRLQLFTENTITPILPLFLSPTRQSLARTGRLWAIVFAANMAGCLLAAAVLVSSNIVPQAQFEGIFEVSRHYAEATAMEHLTWGVPRIPDRFPRLGPAAAGGGGRGADHLAIITYMIGSAACCTSWPGRNPSCSS